MDSQSLLYFASKQRYIVIDSSGTAYVFPSLRDIEKNLEIDHSTISKKLKISVKGDIFSSRRSGDIYHIRRVCSNPIAPTCDHMDHPPPHHPLTPT